MAKNTKKLKKPSQTTIDNLWSKLVKLKAKSSCEYCGKAEGLNSHHIFSRSNRATRWDETNGISLCINHHVFGTFSAHKAPVEFVEWLKTYRGEDWYKELRRKANTTVKPDYLLIKDDLKKKLEAYEI